MQTTGQGVRNLNNFGPRIRRVKDIENDTLNSRAITCLLGHDLDDDCKCKKCGAYVLDEDEQNIKEIW